MWLLNCVAILPTTAPAMWPAWAAGLAVGAYAWVGVLAYVGRVIGLTGGGVDAAA